VLSSSYFKVICFAPLLFGMYFFLFFEMDFLDRIIVISLSNKALELGIRQCVRYLKVRLISLISLLEVPNTISFQDFFNGISFV